MTVIPLTRPGDDTPGGDETLPTTRAGARRGTLEPVPASSPLRFPATTVRELVVPPDVWSEKRPSLRDLWLYSVYGPWTGERTPSRYLGIAYSLLALSLTAVGYLLLWIVERPARAGVALALFALLFVSGVGPF